MRPDALRTVPSILVRGALAAVLLTSASALAACSAGTDSTAAEPVGTEDAGGHDAGPLDAGPGDDASAFVPLAHPKLPLLVNQGGPILPHVAIVTVTWPADPIAHDLATFDAWMPTSDFYTSSVAEYGPLAGSYDGAWSPTSAAPATLDDAAIQKMLLDAWAATTNKLPAPSADRLYTIYPPAGTTVTSFGTEGCTGFQAYHSSVKAPTGETLVYAVMPRCAETQGMTPLDFVTWGSSHEIGEAATDPIASNPAWVTPADPSFLQPEQGENGDLCTGFPMRVEGHMVTALYSTKAAAADERPCVPAAKGPMFGMFAKGDAKANRVKIAAGKTVSVPLAVYSTAPTPPLKLVAYPFDTHVTAKLSQSTGVNGDTPTVSITVAAGTPSGLVTYVDLYTESSDYHYQRYVEVTVP